MDLIPDYLNSLKPVSELAGEAIRDRARALFDYLGPVYMESFDGSATRSIEEQRARTAKALNREVDEWLRRHLVSATVVECSARNNSQGGCNAEVYVMIDSVNPVLMHALFSQGVQYA